MTESARVLAQVLFVCLHTMLFSLLPNHDTLTAQEYLGLRQDTTGTQFTYDEHSQYVRISLKRLSLPRSTGDDNAVARFFRALLQGRDTEFALATLEVALPNRPIQKRVLYSLERDGRNYNVTALAAGAAARYRLTDAFVFDESLPVGITIRRTEWEERQDVLGALVSQAEGLLGPGTAAIASTVSGLLNTMSDLFPPDDFRTGMSATVTPRDLTSPDLIVTSELQSHTVDLFTLEFEIVEGYFRDYSLADGLSRAGLNDDVASWTNMVRDADRQIEAHGLGPLDAALLAFSDYVVTLPLTRRDRAIMTACAIKDWAPNAYRGIQHDGQDVQFTASRYLRLAPGNLEAIQGSPCDMPNQVDCNTGECRSMADFLSKSARGNGRRAAAELYIDESLSLLLNGQEIEATADDYVEKFRIRRPAFFEKRRVVDNQWSFIFEPGALTMSYDDSDYQESRIIIDVSRVDVDGGQRYIVTGVEAQSTAAGEAADSGELTNVRGH